METVTPAGTGTGYLPTRDMTVTLEHATEDFAANIGGARFRIAEHAARRGQDGDTETGIDARQFLDLGIDAAAGLGDAGDFLDDGLTLVVFQLDAQLADAGRSSSDVKPRMKPSRFSTSSTLARMEEFGAMHVV